MAAARNLAPRFISDLSSSALDFYNCARNMTIYVLEQYDAWLQCVNRGGWCCVNWI